MRYCTNCGHQLGIGRYCTNCGARVPVAPTEPPPPLGPEPASARYPLFADTVPASPAPTSPPPVSPPPPAPPAQPPRRRRPALPWIAALAVLALIAVTGVLVLVLGGPDDGDTAGDHPGDRPAAPVEGQGDEAGAPSADAPSGTVVPARVEVPGTAPASVDSDGAQVTFVAANMLDGDPRTSWRVAGDASGAVITFTFDHPVTLSEVGLVNGYAKTDPPHDWYDGNRRITDVTWVFDDGTEVPQALDPTESMQTVDVDRVETTTLGLHVDGVTAPGTGPDGRNYTAISDVSFVGG